VAVCDGGSGALGHPIEYIQLNNVSDEPSACKYCGLRFKMKAGAHHH
jgi:NADH dehydrogenase (ubiquinone) Fe-S protein 6